MASKPTASADELVNVRLKQKKTSILGLSLKPRQYQTELCNRALEQNVVIYLGTGLGKTFVTVLYLNSPQIAAQIHEGKKVVFLAPTQDLIKQQAEYINRQTLYRVKIFCGRSAHCGEHIDHWDKEIWEQEIAKVDLLFMTPQIFAAAISTNILDWSQFSTLIFDEVHHASRNKKKQESKHPYGQILSHYKTYFGQSGRCDPPRMIGLTASVINSMPKDRSDITQEVKYLERMLHATCVTDLDVQDRRPVSGLSVFSAREINEDNDVLTSILVNLKVKIDETLQTNQSNNLLKRNPRDLTREQMRILAFTNRLKLATAGISIKPASFAKVIDGLIGIRKKCGLYALKAICQSIVDALDRPHTQAFLSPDIQAVYQDFSTILKIICKSLEVFSENDSNKQLLSYSRPKVLALLNTLKHEYSAIQSGDSRKSSFSCIVFVRSRLEVVALNLLVQRISQLPEYNFIKCDFAIGLAAAQASKYACITKRKPVEQYAMLKEFREGKRNVIITTSVLEEGIDLPVCSTVIRYDLARNFREYVQSRGRARQEISSFISVCESKAVLETEGSLNIMHDFELTLKEVLRNNNSIGSTVSHHQVRASSLLDEEDQEDFFLAKGGAIKISSTTARTIINMYCNQLSKNTPFLEGVTYSMVQPTVETFKVTLYLPSGSPLAGGIEGRVKSAAHLAENSALVAAVKALYELKELNENGVPTRCNDTNVNHLLASIGLEPKYDPLDENLEGITEIVNDKEVYFFRPRSSQPANYLSRDYENRLYKLIKLRYVGLPGQVRADVAHYFEKCVYGLIVDSFTSNEFIPGILHSHYGVFRVDYDVIDNIRIMRREDHHEYLNYTHKMLTRCLTLGPIKTQDLAYRCLFYVVPLNEKDQPDLRKMHESFQAPPVWKLATNDIVKLSFHYIRNNRDKNNNQLMLVKQVRSDLNAKSIIPGRRSETFLEHAESNYGRNVIREIDQPVIEVVPLSAEFASMKEAKKIRVAHNTQSLFYLAQFLELFDRDPACVLQAFNKPEIFMRLYQVTAVQELDRKFVHGTQDHRVEIPADVRVSPAEIELPEKAIAEPTEVGVSDDESFEYGSGEDDSSESLDGEEGEFEEEVANSDDGASDSSETDSDDIAENEYKQLLMRRNLNLNDDGDDDYKAGKWDLSKYQVANLPKTDYTRQEHFHSEPDIAYDSNYPKSIMDLSSEIRPTLLSLLDKLRNIELRMTSDAAFSNQEEELSKRTAKVDKTIQPTISFTEPLRNGSRERSLLEALTLRRATVAYNLESLENIGDSYLKYLTSVVLFKSTDGNEGMLSLARSLLTCNKRFTYLAKKRQLGFYAITRPFSKDDLAYTLGRPVRQGCSPRQFYNRMRPKDLADIFESLVGSYLLYQGEYETLLLIEWLGIDVISKEPSLFAEIHERSVIFSRAPRPLLFDNREIRDYFEYFKKSNQPFEDIISYKFNDPSYLMQAFTHATALKKCTRSYERLELLGDAILDYAVSRHLSTTSASKDPGQLTASRSALVNNYAFARLALKYKFDLFIQHTNLELHDELTRTRIALDEDPEMGFVDMTNFDKIVKLLGDVFESVAGAIYLDSGNSVTSVWEVYWPMMKESIEKELREPTKNPTATLYEMFPGKDRITFEPHKQKTADGDVIEVRCKVVGFGEFEGTGLTERQAKLRAVLEALKNPPSEEMRNRINQDFLDSERVAGRMPPPRRGRGGRGRGRGAYRGPSGRALARPYSRK